MEKIVFITNPVAGGKSKEHIIRFLQWEMPRARVQWEIVRTEYPGHAGEIAASTDADCVVAVGGDGTVNEVAAAIAGTTKVLGIIPCGSGDGLARHLHISHVPVFALRTILGGRVAAVDNGTIDGRPFFCTCGVGLDAIVSFRFAAAGKRGLQTYIREAERTWKGFVPEHYELVADGKPMSLDAVLITVGNANQWGNEARIAPAASLVDGLLDVTVIKPFRTAEIPLLAAMLMDGRLLHNPRVMHFRCRSLTVRRAAAGPAHIDGNPLELGAGISFGIRPGALKVLVPARRTGKI